MRWPPVNGLSTPSAQGAYSLRSSTAKPAASPRKATTLHPAANKDTGTSASLFSTSSPTCCTKAARYYYWTLFRQSSKRSLGLRSTPCLFFLPSSVALSISCSFVYPLLATTAYVLVAKEEKQPFKGLGLSLLAMNMLHSLLSSTRFLRYCYSTLLSTGIIKNKTAFSRLPLPLLPLPLSSSSVKIPGSEAQEIHLLCCSGGGGEEWDDAPAS